MNFFTITMALLTIQDEKILMTYETSQLWRAKYGDSVPQLKKGRVFITTKNRQMFINHDTLKPFKMGTLIIHDTNTFTPIQWNDASGEDLLPDEVYTDPKEIPFLTDKMLESKQNFEFTEITDKKNIHYVPFVFNKCFVRTIVIYDNKIIYQANIEVYNHNKDFSITVPAIVGMYEITLKAGEYGEGSSFKGAGNYRWVIFRT